LATVSADAMMTFWARQMTPHTLSSMVMPNNMPVMIAVPSWPLKNRSASSPCTAMIISPNRKVMSAA
jgi:hypothetical protein